MIPTLHSLRRTALVASAGMNPAAEHPYTLQRSMMAIIDTAKIVSTLGPEIEKYYEQEYITTSTSTSSSKVPTPGGWVPISPAWPTTTVSHTGMSPPPWRGLISTSSAVSNYPSQNTFSVYGINILILANVDTTLVKATFNHETFTRAKLQEESIEEAIVKAIEDVQKEYPEHREMVRAIDARMSGRSIRSEDSEIMETINYVNSLKVPAKALLTKAELSAWEAPRTVTKTP